jgi:HSP20 family molecular chaperone IbpA
MLEKKPKPSVAMQPVPRPVGTPRRQASERDLAHARWPALNNPSSETSTAADTSWSPKIDVFERGKRLITRVDLPGVRARHVTVVVIDDHLVISGRRPQEPDASQDRYWRSERNHGAFHRAVPLPKGIQSELVSATFDGGILEVSLLLPTPRATTVTRVPIGQPGRQGEDHRNRPRSSKPSQRRHHASAASVREAGHARRTG